MRISILAAALLLTPAFTLQARFFHLDTPVAELLTEWGQPPPEHQLPPERRRALEQQGAELFYSGRTTVNGQRTKFQSLFFRCADCHLAEREDPRLSSPTPEARLAYLVEHELPLLPGTTLHGTVNKTSWYNGDWRTGRYRDVVTSERYAADRSLRGAVRLCSEQCSQGRELTPVEVDALLAFLWTLELRLSDLVGEGEFEIRHQEGQPGFELTRADLPALLRSHRQASAGTLGKLPPPVLLAGNPAAGRAVFQQSCLSCHSGDRPGDKIPFNEEGGLAELRRLVGLGRLDRAVRESVRPPAFRQGVYMPEYTLERMSDQQLADLKAFASKPSGATSMAPVLSRLVSAQTSAPDSDSPRTNPALSLLDSARLTREVQVVFDNKCSECHDPASTHDEAEDACSQWSSHLLLDELRKYHIKDSDPSSTRLWLVSGDTMPPDNAASGGLTEQELQTIRRWIQAGAPSGLPPRVANQN